MIMIIYFHTFTKNCIFSNFNFIKAIKRAIIIYEATFLKRQATLTYKQI